MKRAFIELPLRSCKAGRFLVASILLTVRPIVKCGPRVSRAPPHHTLPASLNLHGRIQNDRTELLQRKIKFHNMGYLT